MTNLRDGFGVLLLLSLFMHAFPVACIAGFLVSDVWAAENIDKASGASGKDLTLVADTGGPYTEEVGREITFNGSKSRDAEKIKSFLWDFGDGATAYGEIATHNYSKPGLYNLSLTVSDSFGGSSKDTTGVYVHAVELSVNVVVYPIQEKYGYGDRITGLDAVVSYPDKSRVLGAAISGNISGRQKADLLFKEVGGGRYHADLNYPVLKGEGGFLEVYVKAIDGFGNTRVTAKKIFLTPEDAGFALTVEEPHDRVFACGQDVLFEVGFINPTGRSIEQEDVTLYDGWAGRNFSFTRNGESFSLVYTIPKGVAGTAAFSVYGEALVDGKRRSTVKTVELEISDRLNVDFIKPTVDQYSSDVPEVAVNITYPNGEVVKADRLDAIVNGKPLVLERRNGFFAADYVMDKGLRSLSVMVRDEAGNKGESEILLAAQAAPGYGFDPAAILPLLSFLIFIIVAAAASLFFYYRNKPKREFKEEYRKIKERRDALKKLTKSIMHEYYTRQITEVDAKNRILDYEKEMMIEREKMRGVLHKIGLKKKEIEGKEELIEGIVEKLENGVEPRKIKEDMVDTGIDPRIVDEIRKKLM